MLQQTQVKTVIPYFKNFIQKFPSQKKLSEASEDQILAAWSGLGFYRRARNIFASKEIIKKEYGNKFPKKFNHIVTLPGIGKSTAGAILSLAYLDPHPILDGNETESIWKNLWLPFKSVSLKNYVQDFQLIGTQEIQHELTHRKLKINLNTYMTSDELKIKTNLQYKWIKKDRIDEYGLPKPISKVISEL